MTTDEDNKRLRNDIHELKARQRLELERVAKEKEEEMEEVHKRFPKALCFYYAIAVSLSMKLFTV